jgi:hypothetical protein
MNHRKNNYMNILSSLITFVPDVIKLFKGKTPKKGNDIAKVGAILTAVGGGGIAATSNIPSADDVTNVIVAITQFVSALTAFIGAIAVVVGKSQVEKEDGPEVTEK